MPLTPENGSCRILPACCPRCPRREKMARHFDRTARLLDPYRTPLEEGGMKQSDAKNFLSPGLAASPRADQG